MELAYGTLIKINDPSSQTRNLTGVVLVHDLKTNKVMYRIVADGYVGIATHKTNRWNCTVIGKYEGELRL